MRRRACAFLLVFLLLVLYTGLQARRLAPGAPEWAPWAATTAFFWLILGWMRAQRAPGGEPRWLRPLAWAASLAFGVWAAYLALSLLADGAALALAAAGAARPGLSAAQARGLLSLAAVLAALGYLQVRLGPYVREVSVPIAGLPPELDGLRIAHVSDLHVGPTIREGYVERVAAAVEALKPDLIAITGDLGDGRPETLTDAVRPLSRLKAPLGAYYVTGNHEYYWGAEGWLRAAAALGWTTLVDEGRIVERGGRRILVGGVADRDASYFVESHRSDPVRAAAGGEDAALRVLLAHRPDASTQAARAGFQLQLSGHTHGGQFFPFSLAIGLFHRHHRGLSREGPLWVYVNPGTGYWGPPHRLGVPAEISLLRLRSTGTSWEKP